MMARFGEPEDVAGECNAKLYIGDNFGDNHATMRCQLFPGHEGRHREMYQTSVAGTVTVEWDKDESSFYEDDPGDGDLGEDPS